MIGLASLRYILSYLNTSYVRNVEAKICAMVCLSCQPYLGMDLHIIRHQMVQYRQDSTMPTERPPQCRAHISSETPAFMSLAEKYGEADMRIGNPSSQEEQTIEQEYKTYVTATLSSLTTNLVKFWEVSICNNHWD